MPDWLFLALQLLAYLYGLIVESQPLLYASAATLLSYCCQLSYLSNLFLRVSILILLLMCPMSAYYCMVYSFLSVSHVQHHYCLFCHGYSPLDSDLLVLPLWIHVLVVCLCLLLVCMLLPACCLYCYLHCYLCTDPTVFSCVAYVSTVFLLSSNVSFCSSCSDSYACSTCSQDVQLLLLGSLLYSSFSSVYL